MKTDFSQWNRLIKKLENNKKAKRNALVYIGAQIENEYQKEVKKISVTNELSRSVQIDIGVDRVTVGAEAKYARQALETGTRPGSKPDIKSLALWVSKRGLPKGLEYPIAKKIEAEGTRKYKKGAPKQLTRIKNQINRKKEKFAEYLLEELLK